MTPPLEIAFHPPYIGPCTSAVAHAVLERMLEHFFPETILVAGGAAPVDSSVDMAVIADGHVAFNWYGTRYTLQRHRGFSVFERLLLQTIIETASARLLGQNAARAADGHRRASLEDHCVASFVASSIIGRAGAEAGQFFAP